MVADPDFGAGMYSGSLVRQGGRHRADHRNNQDHAVALSCSAGVVLAVADGVSSLPAGKRRLPTQTEVGAFLVAEVAARAALDALVRGVRDPKALKQAAASSLVEVVGPLWRHLGLGAAHGLYSTLILAIATPSWARVWAAGDGAWGVVLGPGTAPSVACADPEQLLTFAEGSSRHGGRHLDGLDDCVARAASRDVVHVGSLLEPVVLVDRRVTALWVATDGLRDEPEALELLRRPVRDAGALTRALRRPADSDDLAVAFTATRRDELTRDASVHIGPQEVAHV